jgi:general secretion pathway protein G
MSLKKKAARGFTLIELVIVIAVIAILAALLVPTILGQAERARVSRAKGEVLEISKALGRMRTDTGASGATGATCFTTLTNLNSATSPGTNCSAAALPVCGPANAGQLCWGGPYMSANVSTDPWTQPYTVSYDSSTASITVTSTGQDKTAGGGDDIIVKQ